MPMPTIAPRRVTRSKETYDLLRERIQSMAPGVPLPPVKDLMAEFSVSQSTLVSAYTDLESNGLITRKPRKGVFVADRAATGEMAIVVRPQILEFDSAASYRLSCAALTEALHETNELLQVRMHLGKATPTGSEFVNSLDLLNAAVLPQLRGVFSFHDLFDLDGQLVDAGIPIVHLHNRGGRYHVSLNEERFFDQCVAHLFNRGVSTVGMIWSMGATEHMPAPRNWARKVSNAAKQLGMECRPEWMPYQKIDIQDSGVSERQGYELFMRLWKQPERPEGLIVYDDVLCKGVLRAISELGLKLPDDLRLISYANKGIDLPFSKKVTRVEFDMKERGRMAVRMMETLLHGDEPDECKVMISGKLIEGETT